MYDKITEAMDALNERHLAFGSSITLTTENMEEVTSEAFLETLEQKGTKVVFYVEFVPVTPEAKHLAPGDEAREWMKNKLQEIRENHPNIILYLISRR